MCGGVRACAGMWVACFVFVFVFIFVFVFVFFFVHKNVTFSDIVFAIGPPTNDILHSKKVLLSPKFCIQSQLFCLLKISLCMYFALKKSH